MADPTPQQILDTPMPTGNDAGAKTVRGYLITLLSKLWEQEADFNSKRPFGNSGWAYDVYGPLAKAGLIEGTFDEDGYIEDVDPRAADRLIVAAIRSLDQPAPAADPAGVRTSMERTQVVTIDLTGRAASPPAAPAQAAESTEAQRLAEYVIRSAIDDTIDDWTGMGEKLPDASDEQLTAVEQQMKAVRLTWAQDGERAEDGR